MAKHEDLNIPKCPYCNHEHQELTGWAGTDDGASITPTCNSCHRKFEIICHVSITYDSHEAP